MVLSNNLTKLDDDPLWYKDAVIYEVHVRAFADSNGDGVGDFRGLVRRLDYLRDLGCTAIWILPFYPSPLRDDGYDIADYTAINPLYGTLSDFKVFLRAAHERGIRVIIELVINHTSDRHPWFQRARQAPEGSVERDFYVWSKSPEKYRDARVIFKDFEPSNWTWDGVAQSYYWHRFFSHQPDLNFERPEVQQAIFDILDFWMNLGIDGFRLDAVPYLFEREGTNCENLPETHAFLRRLRQHIDRHYPNRMLLAEANQWPEDAVAYFGNGDECHMAFHFPVMPRLFMAIRMEDRFPIIDILQQTPPIAETSQWALFLRNHDELTLEMVTDEDRDYMYRMYAQDPQARINLGIRRRLAPLLENHRGKIELMNGLLFSLPGTPVVYYGDEIGMGDNIYLGDRNGVRTPMQWSGERNAGFSRANPQRLFLPVIIDPEYHFEMVNVESQQNNSHSLLWWMKRLIALRKRFKAFGRGSLEFLAPRNHKVLAFVRRYHDETILIVANLSRFPQFAEVDLSRFQNMRPVEMFGRTPFPHIGDRAYVFTLGSYAFYWFLLEPVRVPAGVAAGPPHWPMLSVPGDWDGVFLGSAREGLEESLRGYLRQRNWFSGKTRQVEAAMILETVPIPYDDGGAYLALVQVEYSEGDSETYAVPLAFARGDEAGTVESEAGDAVIARLEVLASENGTTNGLLFDCTGHRRFDLALLEAIGRRRRFRRTDGEIVAQPTSAYRRLRAGANGTLMPTLLRPERSNSSVVFGERFILKLFRRLEEGVNPELELERFLAERTSFAQVPAVAGVLEYRRSWGRSMTLALLHEFVPNQADGWRFTLDALGTFYDRTLTGAGRLQDLPVPPRNWREPAGTPLPVQQAIGPYLETARLIGRRTAEFHLALASDTQDPSFAPESFTPVDQRSFYQSLRGQARRSFDLLHKRIDDIPAGLQSEIRRAFDVESKLLDRLRDILTHKVEALRIRCHGNYHLEQLLYTGKDIVIIDLDGEANRPLSERRRKQLPLMDVATMIRSFQSAALTALYSGNLRSDDKAKLEPWCRFWQGWVTAAFWTAYVERTSGHRLLPEPAGERSLLLEFSILRRILRELASELQKAPERLRIPIRGLIDLAADSQN
jgi:maltose alpha-D-glucosyltransferase/alpha-amylase